LMGSGPVTGYTGSFLTVTTVPLAEAGIPRALSLDASSWALWLSSSYTRRTGSSGSSPSPGSWFTHLFPSTEIPSRDTSPSLCDFSLQSIEHPEQPANLLTSLVILVISFRFLVPKSSPASGASWRGLVSGAFSFSVFLDFSRSSSGSGGCGDLEGGDLSLPVFLTTPPSHPPLSESSGSSWSLGVFVCSAPVTAGMIPDTLWPISCDIIERYRTLYVFRDLWLRFVRCEV